MIDIDPASTCRICLDDGAIYPIFESTNEIEGVYAKLATCIRDKIENIEGYPRNICLNCKNTSDTICSFVSQFEETCRILKKKIVEVKTEQQDFIDLSDNDFDNNDDYQEPLAYEQEIDKLPMKPKPEKRDPTELLESLKHLTVKKIKVENESGETSSVVRKRGRPRKQPAAPTKSVKITKVPRPEKKPVKPVPVLVVKKEMKIPPPPPPETKTIKDVVAEKALRLRNIKELIRQNKFKIKDHTIRKKKKNEIAINTSRLCDICGDTFEGAEKLFRHQISAHGKKKFICTKCPRAYYGKKSLKDHVEKNHEKLINVVCDFCGKGFYFKKDLSSHITTVHLHMKRSTNTIYKCSFCDKTFKYKNGAIIHERAAHTGERPAKCDVCDSSFLHDSYLAEHMRLHTGETPFKCPVCGRGYAQRGNMKSHMRNHKISELTTDVLARIKPNYFKFMRP